MLYSYSEPSVFVVIARCGASQAGKLRQRVIMKSQKQTKEQEAPILPLIQLLVPGPNQFRVNPSQALANPANS